MALTTTTDHTVIAGLLDPLLAADPVRGTVLGTVRTTLGVGAWAAHSADGARLAARSAAPHPLVLAGPWDEPDLGELARLLGRVPDLSAVSGSTPDVERVVELLAADGRRPGARQAQRLFRLDRLLPPTVSGRARLATQADRALVTAWYRAFAAEAQVPPAGIAEASERALADGCWLWADGDCPVSLAARRAAVAGSARIGPVYTPPEFRGHGYGSAATAAATRDVLDEGAVPVLFTDLDNPVSNAIYPRLGYTPVEDRLVVRFG